MRCLDTLGHTHFMASKFQRERSPYWWIKTKIGAENGKYRRYATRFRIGNSVDTRAANELVHTLCAQEYATTGAREEERWEAWLNGFLEVRYRRYKQSLLRYQIAWNNISMFLKEHEIETPRQLTRTHCFNYLEWRGKPNKKDGKYKAGHNTALLELKFLGLVMKEAVHRNFAPANPCRELGISRDPVRKPSDLTEKDLGEIEKAIASEPEDKQAFLLPSYTIAKYHGVRLTETHLNPMEDVDLQAMEITFHQKGGRERVKPLHPALVEMFKELQAKKAKETFPMPKSFAKEWHNFFLRHKLPSKPDKPCFHSLRVMVQNKLRRAGINDEIRKRYLSHESKGVHEGYSRIQVDEMRVCHAVLS